MLLLRLLPAILSALVLAAHFLRRGNLVLCAVCVAAAALPALRRRWVPSALQVFLALGTMLWLVTLRGMVEERTRDGEPWHRLVLILGSVALVAVVGIVLLGSRRVHERYAAPLRD